jgi:hypothetical protein
MNRITYRIQALNEYNLHSPFLFSFYNEVINSSISEKKIGVGKLKKSHKIIYKVSNTFGGECIFVSKEVVPIVEDVIRKALNDRNEVMAKSFHRQALIVSLDEWESIKQCNPSVIFWYKPHATRMIERDFETFRRENGVNVVIDMYSVAICLVDNRLKKQYFILA